MSLDKGEALLAKLNGADIPLVIDVIKHVTEIPGVFVFGEFLEHPAVQSLQGTSFDEHFRVINLFCYGSYETYCLDVSGYPQLSDRQVRKLKQLSIINEAHYRRCIPYGVLFQKLSVTSSRELEDLIIELIYLDALSGKLDQQKALLEVDSAVGRDIQEEHIPQLYKALDIWLDRVETVVLHMAKEIKLANERKFETEFNRKKVLEATSVMKDALKRQITKTDMDVFQVDLNDPTLHPDLLPDGRSAPVRVGNLGFDSPGGDKETARNRGAVFKNIRHAKSSGGK